MKTKTNPDQVKEKEIKVEEKKTQTEKKTLAKETKVKATPKSTKPHPKSMHRQRGKKYQEVKKLVDKTKKYTLEEAIKLARKISYANFDASLELHINTTKTGKIAEVDLPHGTGKTKRIVIVNDQVLKNIEKGKLDFDILITHPQYMPKLAQFARVLGPKGLMPNPKNGTITTDPEKLKTKLEKGTHLIIKTEPKAPIIHLTVGKLSLSDKQLQENIITILKVLKPTEVKSIYLSPTMGPSVPLQF